MRDHFPVMLPFGVASAAVLLALMSLWSTLPPGDMSVFAALKIVVNVVIIASALVALVRPRAFLILAVTFTGLVAYNVYQGMAGHQDCGCFSVTMSPWVTALIDGVLALGSAAAVPTMASVQLPIARCAAGILAASITAGALIEKPLASDSMNTEMSGELLPAGVPDSFSLLVYRSDCQKCLTVVSRFRALSEERQASLLIADLNSLSVLSFPEGYSLRGEPIFEMVRALAHIPVPSFVRIAGRKVVSIEDAAALKQW